MNAYVRTVYVTIPRHGLLTRGRAEEAPSSSKADDCAHHYLATLDLRLKAFCNALSVVVEDTVRRPGETRYTMEEMGSFSRF